MLETQANTGSLWEAMVLGLLAGTWLAELMEQLIPSTPQAELGQMQGRATGCVSVTLHTWGLSSLVRITGEGRLKP